MNGRVIGTLLRERLAAFMTGIERQIAFSDQDGVIPSGMATCPDGIKPATVIARSVQDELRPVAVY